MLNIRPTTKDDAATLLSLIRELATYEKKPDKAVITEDDLMRDAFGQEPKFRLLIAEWNGKPVGYAAFFYFYSTYQGRAALFLEDLFVQEKYRGNGIGKALLVEVVKLAIREKCFGMRWEVLDWNRQAIEFYQKLGATFLDERRLVSFDEAALRRVAGSSANSSIQN